MIYNIIVSIQYFYSQDIQQLFNQLATKNVIILIINKNSYNIYIVCPPHHHRHSRHTGHQSNWSVTPPDIPFPATHTYLFGPHIPGTGTRTSVYLARYHLHRHRTGHTQHRGSCTHFLLGRPSQQDIDEILRNMLQPQMIRILTLR